MWDTMQKIRLTETLNTGKTTSHIKGPESIFNKTKEEKFPNLKNEIYIEVKEAYKILNRLG